ncbi:MAG: hypothetical protein HOE90_03685 [Bacteriovoracaceae bacterium]|jgi:hypothetical protein|nr:hypothetical protein [Bacteriovoracaceae bacterium]
MKAFAIIISAILIPASFASTPAQLSEFYEVPVTQIENVDARMAEMKHKITSESCNLSFESEGSVRALLPITESMVGHQYSLGLAQVTFCDPEMAADLNDDELTEEVTGVLPLGLMLHSRCINIMYMAPNNSYAKKDRSYLIRTVVQEEYSIHLKCQ